MKKTALFASTIALLFASPIIAGGADTGRDITCEIPEGSVECKSFKKRPDVAQYGDGDWSGVLYLIRDISAEKAMELAEADSNVTFFFYMKGDRLVLGTKSGDYRVFNRGDAVFFSGEPTWGSAPGLADGYIKNDLL